MYGMCVGELMVLSRPAVWQTRSLAMVDCLVFGVSLPIQFYTYSL